MTAMMTLVVGWTLVGAFAFTVAVTCFSLVGWVRFADPAQQKRLFQVLVVEVVVAVGARFAGAARFDPAPVEKSIRKAGANEELRATVGDLLRARDGEPVATREALEALVERIDPMDRAQVEAKRDLQTRIRALPQGVLKPSDVDTLRRAPSMTTFRVAPSGGG